MNYGAFIDDLPMVLGTEKLLMFQRKINRSEITQDYYVIGKARRYYKEIRLGGRDEVFQVFTEHTRLHPYAYEAWQGAGYDGIKGYLPEIADDCFISNANDNFLQLREDGWYLVVFNYRNDTEGKMATAQDFYVYALTDAAQAKDKYGLNLYRPDGSLIYHSGWDLMRVRHRPTPADMGGLSAPFRIVDDKHPEDIWGLRVYDFLSEQGGFYVGDDKLVSIGFCASFRYSDGGVYIGPTRAYFTPVLHQGRVRLSMCHAYTGINFPHNLYRSDTQLGLSDGWRYNEITVIDKPQI